MPTPATAPGTALVTVLVLASLLALPLPAPPAAARADAFTAADAGAEADAGGDAGGSPRPVGVWPLTPEPEVAHGFDPPADPWGQGHRGVDLRGAPGQVVRTALPGTVAYAGRLAGRGVVTVEHGGTRTTYEPVTATVEVGRRVGRGAPIGLLELPGSHCFPAACLHWGWLRGEVYLDPLDLVGGGPVRLLPLWRDLPARAGPASPAAPGPWMPPWWTG